MRKNTIVYLSAVAILIISIFIKFDKGQNINFKYEGAPVSSQNKNKEVPVSGMYYKVVRVVDGDTFIADISGEEVSVRLVGIDTPESVDPNKPVECFGKEASNELKNILGETKIRFEVDDTQGSFDKYGRLLAYVWTEDGVFLNLDMLKKGYAYEYTYFGVPYKYQTEFKQAKNVAKEGGLGLWAKDVCK